MPTLAPVAVKTSTPGYQSTSLPTPESPIYDPTQIMYELFSGFSLVSPQIDDVLDEIRANKDRSEVPVMVEVLRYMPSRNSRDKSGSALREVTGQTFESDDWSGWMEWLGKNRENYQPHEGYVD